MKFTGFLLAASFVGAHAVTSQTWLPNAGQNVKENVCKGTIKDLLTCAITSEYVPASDSWVPANTCVDKFQGTLSKCRGGSVSYVDKATANLTPTPPVQPEPGHPAYVAAGTVSKLFAVQGLVGIPSQDQKLRGVSCSICAKFTSKLLECALPVTAGADARAAFFNAASQCLTASWDKVLYNMCFKGAFVSPLQADANGKVNYVFASPRLIINDLQEECPSVEAKAKPNGAVFARIGKGHIKKATP